jgi:hypothetical protein
MRDLAFYEVGCHELNGIKRVVIPFRRLLRRLLLPIFLHLDSQLKAIDRRQNQLDRDMKAVLGMGWDHVAIARRLGVLEDHVEALLSLDRRQNQLDRDMKAVLGMGWDHVAIARRLALLEDHVEALLSRETGGDSNRLSEDGEQPLIRYPRLDAHTGDDDEERAIDVQSKVS